MRKFLTVVAATLITGSLFAGGLVTNTNQSASWVRLPARNASVNIDAVYFNPAGIMKLENGFHFSLSNQTIFQTKSVENFYKGPGGAYGLNQSKYEGKVSAPVFPSFYAAYKMDRFAFSFGFNPVGGGGGAIYAKGLPSFEMTPSDLVPALAASQGATAYRMDPYLDGSSVFFGLQGGVSFKVNDMISVAAGLRYVTAKNTYLGHLKDIEVLLPSGWTRADAIMMGISGQAKGGGDALVPLITGGLGPMTATAAQTAGFITVPQRDAIIGGLTQLGVPNAAALTISQSQTAYYGAQAKYAATSTLLADQEVDVTQTGSGVTPIISVNISPSENLNIGIKYEMATKLVLQNNTVKDFLIGYTSYGAPITMFPEGEMTNNDMPAMLQFGIDYKVAETVKLSFGSNYFFDKKSNYGHKMDLDNNSSTPATPVTNDYIIDHNGFSLQGGAEISLSDKLLVSGGYVWANQGVNQNYQSDLTYGLSTHTFGVGGAYTPMKNLHINLGFGYTIYKGDEQYISHVFSATGQIYMPKETYDKNAMIFAIGADFSF
jgi:long-chain fatty acid transport protein